jgi:hypothetical protein
MAASPRAWLSHITLRPKADSMPALAGLHAHRIRAARQLVPLDSCCFAPPVSLDCAGSKVLIEGNDSPAKIFRFTNAAPSE